MKIEEDPTGLAPHTPGAKLDKGKAPVFRGVINYFPRALERVAFVSLGGAEKYSWRGFLEVDDGPNRYADALSRHLLEEEFGMHDATGELHAAHTAWNALARLELLLRADEHKQPDEEDVPEQLELDLGKGKRERRKTGPDGIDRRRGI